MWGKNKEEDKNNNKDNKKEKKLSIQEKIIKWLYNIFFIWVPFLLWLWLLVAFILNDLIFLWDIRLTEQWLYVILWLFVIAIFPNVIKKTVERRVEEMLKDPDVKSLFEEAVKNSLKIKSLSEKVNEITDEVRGVAEQKELTDKESLEELKNDLKWDKIRNILFWLLKNFSDKTDWIKIFRRWDTNLFWIKNKSQIVVIGDNFNIKIKKDDIKVWDNERDEKWKVIKMSNEEFEEYLENEWLKYFIGKLKINPYWKSLDTIDNYRWVKLDFKYVEDEKFSENFEKLLEVVLENNK